MTYTVVDGTVQGRDVVVRIRDYIPAIETKTAATPLLWIHGGAFVQGGLDQKESDAPARIWAAGGRRVRTLEYRLARNPGLFRPLRLDPDPNRFPAAHLDALDVAAAFRAEVGGPIAIGGASAGANLAAGIALAMRDAGTEPPRALALAYGLFHAELPENPEVERSLRGPLARWLFNPKMTRRINLNYVGGESMLTSGYAFPGGADLRGFAPTLIMDASTDRLRRSGHAFAEELGRAGVELREIVVPGRHGFLDRPKEAAFAAGTAEIAEWLRRHE